MSNSKLMSMSEDMNDADGPVDCYGEIRMEMSAAKCWGNPATTDDQRASILYFHRRHMQRRKIDTTLPARIPSSGNEYEDSIRGYFAQAARNGWVTADKFMELINLNEQREFWRPNNEFFDHCVRLFLIECSARL